MYLPSVNLMLKWLNGQKVAFAKPLAKEIERLSQKTKKSRAAKFATFLDPRFKYVTEIMQQYEWDDILSDMEKFIYGKEVAMKLVFISRI